MAEERKFLQMRSAPRKGGPGLGTFLAGSASGLAGIPADIAGLLTPDTPTIGGKVEMTPEMMGVTEEEAAQLGKQARDIIAKAGTEGIAKSMGLSDEQIQSPEFMLGSFTDPLIALGIGRKLGQATKLRGSGIETRGSGDVIEEIPFSDRGPMPLPETGKDRTTGLTPKGTRPSGLGSFGVSPPFRVERNKGADVYFPSEMAIFNSEEVLGLGRKGLTGKQLLNRLKKVPSVSDAELDRLGLLSFLKENPNKKLTKDELLSVTKENAPNIHVTVRSSEDRFYDEDGFEVEAEDVGGLAIQHQGDQRLLNVYAPYEYREVVFHNFNIPRGAAYFPAHFGDESRANAVFGHARYSIVDMDGKSGFLIEEIQSDLEKVFREAKESNKTAQFKTPDRTVRADVVKAKMQKAESSPQMQPKIAKLKDLKERDQEIFNKRRKMSVENQDYLGLDSNGNRYDSSYAAKNYVNTYGDAKRIEMEEALANAEREAATANEVSGVTAVERAEAQLRLAGMNTGMEKFTSEARGEGHRLFLGSNMMFFRAPPLQAGGMSTSSDFIVPVRNKLRESGETIGEKFSDDNIRKFVDELTGKQSHADIDANDPSYVLMETMHNRFKSDLYRATETGAGSSEKLGDNILDSFANDKRAMQQFRDMLKKRFDIEDEIHKSDILKLDIERVEDDLETLRKKVVRESGVSSDDMQVLAYEYPDEFAEMAADMMNFDDPSRYFKSLPAPPFPDQATTSAFQFRSLISQALEEGQDFVVFPNYVDIASLRGAPENFKLSYDDVAKKVAKDMKTQFGDDVGVSIVNPRDKDGKAVADFVKDSSMMNPMMILDISKLKMMKTAPRGFAKGGHVKAGIGNLFRLYS